MQLINGQMRELCADALHTHAVSEATTCLAVSRTAPLPFGSPFAVLPSPAWGWPSEAQISYSTLLVQLHIPTVLDLYPATTRRISEIEKASSPPSQF
jgi:hypothetical protein